MICLWFALSLQIFALSNEPTGSPLVMPTQNTYTWKDCWWRNLWSSSNPLPQASGRKGYHQGSERACKGQREGRSSCGVVKKQTNEKLEAKLQTSPCAVYLQCLIDGPARLFLFLKNETYGSIPENLGNG